MATTALRDLLDNSSLRVRFPALREPQQLASARASAERLLGDAAPKPPSGYDLVETWKILKSIRDGEISWDELTRRDRRRSPWVLMQPFQDDHDALARDEGFLSGYLDVLHQHGSASDVMALAQAFLRDYPDESSFFESLRESLRSHLLPARRSFRIDRFKARNEAYALLETDGPARLGRALLKADHPERKLEDAGLVGELANGVFVQRAVVRMLDLLSKVLVEERDPDQATAAVTKVIGFLYPDGVKGESRMPALRTCLAESLLIPYEKVDPSPSVQKVIQPFLLDAYGDPRTGHGAWHGVDVRAVSVLKSWLVTATLEDFFRLVRDICNRDASADRMWRYREAFWTAYLNKGVIGDAWVTLAEQSRLYARWLLGNEYSNSYGELKSGYNVKPNHAVLILRIGDLVITEWSHSGSYRLWHTDDPNCPKLYKQRYRREDLVTHPLLARAHHGASNGTWQAQLAKEIAEREMIRIRPKDYMPHA